MCGISGVVSTLGHAYSTSRKNYIINALNYGQIRGMDSTGLFWVSRTGDVNWVKDTIQGSHFVNHKAYYALLSNVDMNNPFVICHNRHGTVGGPTYHNAHPYIDSSRKVVMVHNGTLEEYEQYPDHKDSSTDSARLCEQLGQVAPEKAIKEVISRINGAYAIAWYDLRSAKLNIVRNDERTLGFARDGGDIAIASEKYMAAWLATRDRKRPYILPERMEVEDFHIHTHYSWPLERVVKDRILEPEVTRYQEDPYHPPRKKKGKAHLPSGAIRGTYNGENGYYMHGHFFSDKNPGMGVKAEMPRLLEADKTPRDAPSKGTPAGEQIISPQELIERAKALNLNLEVGMEVAFHVEGFAAYVDNPEDGKAWGELAPYPTDYIDSTKDIGQVRVRAHWVNKDAYGKHMDRPGGEKEIMRGKMKIESAGINTQKDLVVRGSWVCEEVVRYASDKAPWKQYRHLQEILGDNRYDGKLEGVEVTEQLYKPLGIWLTEEELYLIGETGCNGCYDHVELSFEDTKNGQTVMHEDDGSYTCADCCLKSWEEQEKA